MVDVIEKAIGSISHGFMLQFDPSWVGTTLGGGFDFVSIRPDGLPRFPLVIFDYDTQNEYTFQNNFSSIGGGSIPFQTKVFTGIEFPKINIGFIVDASHAKEQYYSMSNAVAKDRAGSVFGAFNTVLNTSIQGFMSEMFGGLNVLDTGIQSISDKFEAMARPCVSYVGGSSLMPVLFFPGLWEKVRCGYITNYNYKILKRNNAGCPTRIQGSFTFEVHPYMTEQVAHSWNYFLTVFAKILDRTVGQMALETGVRLLTNLWGLNLPIQMF